VLFPY